MSRDSDTSYSSKLADKTATVDAEPLNMKDWSVVTVFVLSLIVVGFLLMMWMMGKLSKDPKTLETTRNVVVVAILAYSLMITIWYLVYGINRYDRKINKEGIFIP